MARAEAGRHCTVQSITPPWAGRSGLTHLNHLGAMMRLRNSGLSHARLHWLRELTIYLWHIGCVLMELVFWPRA